MRLNRGGLYGLVGPFCLVRAWRLDKLQQRDSVSQKEGAPARPGAASVSTMRRPPGPCLHLPLVGNSTAGCHMSSAHPLFQQLGSWLDESANKTVTSGTN